MFLRALLVTVAAALLFAAPVSAKSSLTGGVRPPSGYYGPTGGVLAGTPSPGGFAHVRLRGDGNDVPRLYARLYRSAGRAYAVDWRLLAAIGKIESDHGRSAAAGVQSGLNFAHCCAGPMQICVMASCGDVWLHYAVDGDGDGIASVYDPYDAIYGAARILSDLQALFGADRPGLVLAAYNAGPGAVERWGGVPKFAETRSYVSIGLRYMKLLRR